MTALHSCHNQTRSPVLVDLRLRVERKPARPTSNPFLLRGARGTEGSPSSSGAEGFVDGGDGSVTSSLGGGGVIGGDGAPAVLAAAAQ